MKYLNKIFTSGWDIEDSSKDIKSQFQMLNVGLMLSAVGLLFGMVSNYISGDISLIYAEVILFSINIMMFFRLRKDKKSFKYISTILTAQFTALFLFLIYSSEPEAMKHVWLFTYPIIILYYEKTSSAILWILFLLVMILLVPLQPFIDVNYNFHQILYILFVVMIVASIMYFYKIKIDEAKELIFNFLGAQILGCWKVKEVEQ